MQTSYRQFSGSFCSLLQAHCAEHAADCAATGAALFEIGRDTGLLPNDPRNQEQNEQKDEDEEPEECKESHVGGHWMKNGGVLLVLQVFSSVSEFACGCL